MATVRLQSGCKARRVPQLGSVGFSGSEPSGVPGQSRCSTRTSIQLIGRSAANVPQLLVIRKVSPSTSTSFRSSERHQRVAVGGKWILVHGADVNRHDGAPSL